MPLSTPVDIPQPLRFPSNLPFQQDSFVGQASGDTARRRRQFEAIKQMMGTGGELHVFVSTVSLGTTADFIIHDVRHSGEEAMPVADMMRAIKSYLIPQVKDMATVLGVRRPTIYAWLNGEQEPSQAHLMRIQDVYSLVWEAKTLFKTLDRKALEAALIHGPIVSLLQHAPLPRPQLEAQLESIRKQVQQATLRQAGRKEIDLLALARKMGRPSRPDAEARLQLDLLTGKGYSSEEEKS